VNGGEGEKMQMQMSESVMNPPAPNDTKPVREPEHAASVSSDCMLQIQVRVIDLLSSYTVQGVLVGFTPGEVAVLVDEEMPAEREVAVHLSEFHFEGQTLFCGPREGQYEVHISIDDIQGSGLRRAPRFPVEIPAELTPPNAGPVAITIRDISRDGMGIECPVALEIGNPVAVASGPAFVFAVVRHCTPLPGGLYRAGIEMHHLFERPKGAPAEPVQANSVRETVGRWFSRKSQLPAGAKPLRIS
jgi:hypothetical protein